MFACSTRGFYEANTLIARLLSQMRGQRPDRFRKRGPIKQIVQIKQVAEDGKSAFAPLTSSAFVMVRVLPFDKRPPGLKRVTRHRSYWR